MKKTSRLIVLTGILLAALVLPAAAEDKKEITLSGEGKCAKCALHEADKCQNTVSVSENGKTVTYYLADNKVSKDFHSNVCEESKKITVTGTVHEEHGKKMLTASKIELAK